MILYLHLALDMNIGITKAGCSLRTMLLTYYSNVECHYGYFMELFVFSCSIAAVCEIPVLQSKVKVANYSELPLLEGTEIMLTCPNELVLLGHNTSTCGEDSYWIPDPRQTECKGYYYK